MTDKAGTEVYQGGGGWGGGGLETSIHKTEVLGDHMAKGGIAKCVKKSEVLYKKEKLTA